MLGREMIEDLEEFAETEHHEGSDAALDFMEEIRGRINVQYKSKANFLRGWQTIDALVDDLLGHMGCSWTDDGCDNRRKTR